MPMKQKKDLNFSYAGLKNAFRMAVAKVKEARGLPEEADLAHADKVSSDRPLVGFGTPARSWR